MNDLLLYCLLLSAVAIGWWLGVQYAKKGKPKPAPDWIPSIEFLLSDPTPASVEHLLNTAKLDDDSIDLFFKLGRTLRNKGETDRAIHLHQGLFARTELSRTVQMQLELELAIDYFYAGLLDRAENLFLRLLKAKGKLFEQVTQAILDLYEEEGEWQKIYDLYRNKALHHGALVEKRVAHALCEIAEKTFKQGALIDTQQWCRLALRTDSGCARAYVIQGRLAHQQGEYHEAVRCFLRAVEVDAHAVITVLELMHESFLKLGDLSGLLSHLEKHWEKSRYVPVLKAETEEIIALSGANPALTYLIKELSRWPSNQGFLVLLEVIARNDVHLDKSQLQALYGILRRIVAHEPRFMCEHCGFKLKEFYWRCPSCKSWASIGAYVQQAPSITLDLSRKS